MASVHLILSRNGLPDTSEHHQSKSLWQYQAIFQLSCQHVAREILPRRITSQFIVSPINTITVERGRSARPAGVCVVRKAVQTLETLYGGVVKHDQKLAEIGRIPITRIVEELRIHIKLINLARLFGKDTQIRSPTELFKYLLTSYVKRMTGRFHDRSLSGLIGDLVDSPDYDEVAHRMWRNRNYRRLERNFAWLTRFLVSMSVAMTHTA